MKAAASPAETSWGRPIALAAPTAIGNLAMLAAGLADIYFAGRLGVTAQAVVGLGSLLTGFVVIFVTGALRVVAPTVSRCAQSRPGDCGAILWHSILLVCIGSTAAVILGTGLSLAAFSRGPGAFVRALATYLDVRLLGLVPFAVFLCCNKFLIGLQRPQAIAVLASFGSALNIGLSGVLGLGLLGSRRFGPEGIAMAYVVAWLVGATAQVLYCSSGRLRRTYSTGFRLRRLDRPLLRSLARSGIPLGISAVVGTSSALVPPALLAAIGGAQAVAANSVVNQICIFPQRLSEIFGSASGTLVAAAIGRRDFRSAVHQHWLSLRGALAIFGCMALALVLERGSIAGTLTSDPTVMSLATAAFVPAAVAVLAYAFAVVCINTLIAGEDTRAVWAIEIGTAWVLLVPVAMALIVVLGAIPFAVWLAEAVAVTAQLAALLIRLQSRRIHALPVAR